MAIGDLITKYYQYELNGLLLGSGTDFIITKVEGLYGKPDIKTTDMDRMDAWGEFPGRNMYKGRTITITCDVIGLPDPAASQSIQANYDALMLALALPDKAPPPPPLQLVHYRPWTTAGKRFCYVYPQRAGAVSDADFVMGHVQIPIELKANDPRHYALTQTTDVLTIATGSRNVSDNVFNNGDTAGTPVITLSFTLTGTTMFNTFINSTGGNSINNLLNITNANDSGKAIVLPLGSILGTTMAPGGVYSLVIDLRQLTMTVNGVDVSGAIQASTRFWKMQPGANTVTIDMGQTFPVPVTVDIVHQDTWSG